MNTKHFQCYYLESMVTTRMYLYRPGKWQTSHFIFLSLLNKQNGESAILFLSLSCCPILQHSSYSSISLQLSFSHRYSCCLASYKSLSISLIIYNRHAGLVQSTMQNHPQDAPLQPMDMENQVFVTEEAKSDIAADRCQQPQSTQTIFQLMTAFKKDKFVGETIDLDDDDDEVQIQSVYKPPPKQTPPTNIAQQLGITIQDTDLLQLEADNVDLPEPEVFLEVIDRLSRLSPKYTLEQTLCALDSYFQNADQRSVAASSNAVQTKPTHNQKPPLANSILLVPLTNSLQSNNFVKRHRVKFADPSMTLSYREELERKIAYIFIQKGYGLGITRQALRQDIENNLYNSLLTSVLRSALRKLVDILISNLNIHIDPFESKDEINLRSPMANCRKWLDPKDLATLFKIINVLYCLNSQHIFPHEVVSLYYKICKHIDKRTPPNILNLANSDAISFASKNKPNSDGMIHKQVTTNQQEKQNNSYKSADTRNQTSPDAGDQKQYHKDILHLYLKCPKIDRLLETLAEKYPNREHTAQVVYQTVQKIIKLGLKRLINSYHSLSKTVQLPPFVLNDQIVYILLKDRKNVRFRMMMFKHINDCSISPTEEKLTSAINFINEYVHQSSLTCKIGEQLPHETSEIAN